MVKRFDSSTMEPVKESAVKSIIDKQSVESAKQDRKVRTALYASDYGQCQRKVWFQFFPEDFPPDADHTPRMYRIFANGNDVHVRLSRYLNRETEIEFVEEVNVPRDELDVHGRCDGICTIDNQATVVEFKSINLKEVEEPKTEHQGQLMWYLHMFMKLRKDVKEDFGFAPDDVVVIDSMAGEVGLSGTLFEDLNRVEKWLMASHGPVRGEVIYESKHTQEIFAFPIDYDEGKAKAIEQWYGQVKQYVDAKNIPPVRYKAGSYPCSWGWGKNRGTCQYFETCWGKNAIGADPETGLRAGKTEFIKINGLKGQ